MLFIIVWPGIARSEIYYNFPAFQVGLIISYIFPPNQHTGIYGTMIGMIKVRTVFSWSVIAKSEVSFSGSQVAWPDFGWIIY